MNILLKEKTSGTIYQLHDTIEGIEAVIDFTYSDDDGTLEFECASAESESNPLLSEEELNIVNKELENGLEERYVHALAAIYKQEGIAFNTNHYEI